MNDGYEYICGYAVPFLQVERGAAGFEFFDPHSFDEFLLAPGRAFLNFGYHDAPPICSGLSFHLDEYGLGFVAAVPAEKFRSMHAGMTRDCAFCSIFAVHECRKLERLPTGEHAYRIVSARVEHVTICPSPTYSGTGAWPRDHADNLRPRLAALRDLWQAGRGRYLDQRGRTAAAAASTVAAAATFASRSPQRLIAGLASARGELRAAVAAHYADGGAPLVIGHAAFSKRGGYDTADFAEMLKRLASGVR